MRRIIATAAAALVILGLPGCTETPVRWQPTEEQKIAADLTVKDVGLLRGIVPAQNEPLRAEAEATARITQQYLGLPKQPAESLAERNPELLQQAAQVAGQRPTFTESMTAAGDKMEQVAGAGFTLTDRLLTIAGTLATSFGAYGCARKIGKVRQRAKDAEGQVGTIRTAFDETVTAIDDAVTGMSAEEEAKLKAALRDRQSRQTKLMVTEARL